MSISFEILTKDNCSNHLLDDFERYTKTTKILFVKHQQLHQRDLTFIDDWNQETLQYISQYLCNVVDTGGVVIVGKENGKVIAFTNIDAKSYPHGYINMTYCHVSKPYRGKGIGRQMFQLIEQEARKRGAKALYISAHPSVETQGFYHSVGCVLAQHIIPELYEKEPNDIQMGKRF